MQLGEHQFTDGTTRPVYRSGDGRQYVLDDDGEPVYGIWLHPDEYSGSEASARIRPGRLASVFLTAPRF